ncbi:dinuclear metal center YbgI/SA1388 family protein [Prosthecobacter fusiformis]|uniref:GTP cyclohydrolase 1 type 2 homolog n=1 Tax=Prosthecobacter fusiformis TaxID=48464 RepID=A0A4V3FIA3_9BACT|nr:Nif3-like dinuclear metal center hexameric protein [Prosthecobacter fusiformis]TDU81703.1 dinuclear metal center YbgI/SA1388 family protein [Prosthecobacter fusiformis]
MNLTDLSHYLDTTLRIRELPDYSNAVNGLQLANRKGEITRIAAAVDATLPVVKKAIATGADMLIVHHGMFWSGLQPWTGATFERMRLAIENDLAIYSVHLPLDVHPQLGNNAQIAKAMQLVPGGNFLDYKGMPVGVTCELVMPLDEVVSRFTEALGGSRVHLCAGGPQSTRKIGICSGGSGSEVAAAAKAGVDTFITGEGPHWSYTLAEELGINVLYGGHYATETFGVKALAQHLQAQFSLPWEFVDHPTGL